MRWSFLRRGTGKARAALVWDSLNIGDQAVGLALLRLSRRAGSI